MNTSPPYDLVIGLDRSDTRADLCLIKPLQFEHFRLEVLRLLNEASRAEAATA